MDFNINPKQSHTYSVKLAAPESEFCSRFVQGMADRMAVSFHKYGKVSKGAKTIDMVESLRVRLDKYLTTGNTEFLMDVANFAMIEFMHPRLEGAYFRSTDSRESPGRVRVISGKRDQGRN